MGVSLVWLVEVGFVGERTFEAEGRVKAGSVVEALDVIEDGGGRFIAGGEVAAVDQLMFEGAPERFHGGVVVAVAPAAHGGDAAVLGQRGPIVCTGILASTIRVMKHTGTGSASPQGHVQSGQG